MKWVQWLLIACLSIGTMPSWAKGDSPASIAGAKTVDVAQAKTLFMQGVKFIDVRSYVNWDAGRIPLAYHLEPKKEFTREALANLAAQDEPIVIYCSGLKCHRAAAASKKAVAWGYQKVYYFRLGYSNWKNALNPIE